jgi:prephenate dehydratase
MIAELESDKPGSAKPEITEFLSIQDAMDATAVGEIDACVVPFENSTEGIVNVTMDSLLFDHVDLYIQRLTTLKVSQCLMGLGTDREIKKIVSHQQSLAQCRKFLRDRYPDILQEAVPSNGEAARLASADAGILAIGPVIAAQMHGLKLIQEGIQDEKVNETTFVVLGLKETGVYGERSKTAITYGVPNKPGALVRAISVFDKHSINMTKIISRPMKGKPGEYVFYVELEDCDSINLEEALREIESKTSFFRHLGSFPYN